VRTAAFHVVRHPMLPVPKRYTDPLAAELALAALAETWGVEGEITAVAPRTFDHETEAIERYALAPVPSGSLKGGRLRETTAACGG
jgi:hypothetical protein